MKIKLKGPTTKTEAVPEHIKERILLPAGPFTLDFNLEGEVPEGENWEVITVIHTQKVNLPEPELESEPSA